MLSSSVTRVHAVFKTHFDYGFTDLAHGVLEEYLEVYFNPLWNISRPYREGEGKLERIVGKLERILSGALEPLEEMGFPVSALSKSSIKPVQPGLFGD